MKLKCACVYDEKISSLCSVRKLLAQKHKKPPDISKYVQPNIREGGEMAQALQGYIKSMAELYEGMQRDFDTLRGFCEHCPERLIYYEKRLRELK